MKFLAVWVAVAALTVATSAFAGTTLDFWHSYVHAQDQQRHYGFHLAQYNRGLFVGSCGLSTKSLRWSFTFDLAGDGPAYDGNKISIADDNGKPVHIISGEVTLDAKRSSAKFQLQIESAGATNTFVGNGEYRIHKLN
jgi:hypothetical protein